MLGKLKISEEAHDRRKIYKKFCFADGSIKLKIVVFVVFVVVVVDVDVAISVVVFKKQQQNIVTTALMLFLLCL